MKRTVLCSVSVLIIWPMSAVAKNVDLSTIPPRDTVQLTIYNSEDLTLVLETRTVTFKKGTNPTVWIRICISTPREIGPWPNCFTD